MSSLKVLLEELKTDAVFLKYRGIVKTITSRINLAQLTAEVKQLHAVERSARNLKGKGPSNEKLYKAEAEELATRSRLTEMKLALYEDMAILDEILETIAAHLRTAYDGYFEGFKTETDKKTLMRKILNRGYELKSEMKACDDRIDLVIKDIDQASYGLTRMVALFKILHERKTV